MLKLLKVCSIHIEPIKTFIKIWDKFKHQMSAGKSHLSCFQYHLAFQTAVSMNNFSSWWNAKLDTFHSLNNMGNNQLLSFAYLKSQMNSQHIHRFQYNQVQGVIIC